MGVHPLFLVVLVPFLAPAPTALTTAAAIRELSPTEADEKRPVRLVATVTLWNPGPKGECDLFVQDNTSGIYLNGFPPAAGLALAPGDRIEVEGTTSAGTFAPCIVPTAIRVVGRGGPLPEPEPHTLDPDDNRWLDARHVQAWVFVHGTIPDGKHVRLRVATAKGNAVILAPDTPTEREKAAALTGRVVRFRGVCASPRHDPKTRLAEPIGRVHLQSLADVETAREPADVSTVPIARAVRGFVPGPAPFARPVRVSGVVTFVLDAPGAHRLAVQDETGAAVVWTAYPLGVRVGDRVLVTGYRNPHQLGLTLINAAVTRVGDGAPGPEPRAVTADQLVRDQSWGALVRVEGVVDSASRDEDELFVKCHDGPTRFVAVLVAPESLDGAGPPTPGTRLSFVGVAVPLPEAPNDTPTGFRLRLRSWSDVALVAPPAVVPWWTLREVHAIALGGASVSLFVAAWVLLLRRQIRKQTAELRDRFAREAELERSLQEHRRLEAIGRLVSGIAHDFNNLLTVIVGGGELVAGVFPAGHPAAEWLGAIRRSAERAVDLSRQLLTFAREKPAELAPLDLNAAIGEAEVLVRPTVGAAVHVVAEYGTDVPTVLADPGLLAQIMINLAANARDAMPGGGELVFRTSAERIEGAPLARITVSDTGCGMSAETQARIFEPFFTTKEFGKGTGLGLSTVYGIVRNLGGTIRVRSAPGQGTSFTIDLPAAPADARPATESTPPEPPAAKATILLVDDDPAVREMCAAALRQYGFRVISAETPFAAVELVQTTSVAFDLLVTDAMMPGMSGAELVAALRLDRPAIRVLVMSGYAREEIPHGELLRPTDAFLQKPFTPVHLAGQVHTVLGGDAPSEA